MAIFHFTVKIVGRSKGKSIIAASAYLNGDVMKNEETGKVSYYTSKKEVVYTSLMMCENAPPEWTNVPDENIKRFQKSIRYQRAEDKEAALEKFKITFRKQRLWNEVLKVEKDANAQFGRSFEFSLPKEWSRTEQIEYATDFIQRNFVAKGMCADWSIHDKGDDNPHVHLLVTMRPFKKDHTWGNKEIKDWAFVRDETGNIVIDETHPNWWQDKKTPERHGIRIPVLDADRNQKLDSRNRKQWKREVTDATGWNNPKNCELWRSEWAKECNLHLKKEQQIDHRSYERQGKIEIPTIHEGADARKIEEKYHSGQFASASWKVEENRIIKKQNAILKKLQEVFGQVGILLKQWKERLNDIRRKQRSYSTDGEYDKPDRGTTGTYGRDVSGDAAEGRTTQFVSGAESKIAGIKQRVAKAVSNLAKYRGNVGTVRAEGWRNSDTERGKSDAESRRLSMERISGEVERREPVIAETEREITELQNRLEKARDVDERFKKLKARRADGGNAGSVREHGAGTSTERYNSPKKDSEIQILQGQLNELLNLCEKLNSENKAENVQALKNELKQTRELLQSEKEKKKRADSIIEECQDKLRQAEQEKEYALTHQKKVEIPVEKPVLYERCRNCDRKAYQQAKERYEHQRNGLEKKYKAKAVGFEAMLIVLLWYAIVTTVFAAIRSETFLDDFTAIFDALWNGIRQSCKWIVGVAKALAQVGDRIPNETIAIMVHWLLFIIVIVGAIAVVGILIVIIENKVTKLYRENCWDVISVGVTVTSLALPVYFGDWIKALVRLNLVALLLLVQVVYVGIRVYVKGCKRARGYY